MRSLPTLRRELLTALAVVFAGAVLVAAGGTVLLQPSLESSTRGALYIATLLGADLLVFLLFGRYLVERRVLEPLRRMIAAVEEIAAADESAPLKAPRPLPSPESAEMARLADAVTRMAERLMKNQEALAANILSLQETNRELAGARDAILRAEKMASVGRLAAGIAHEVGNPLSAVMNYLGLAGRGLAEPQRQLILAAESEARRIDRIIRGLLDYARVREARARPVDVNAIIVQSIELIDLQGRFAGIDVTQELADDLPPIRADQHQLQQVFVNLFVNAVDALEGTRSPRIHVRTSKQRHNPALVRPAHRKDDPPGVDYSHRRRLAVAGRVPRGMTFLPAGEVAVIEVMDNGPGIPAELLDQIFEPFVTTKEPGKGTGLGLAVCARLIDGMGGTIAADTLPEGGAVFRIFLPAFDPMTAALLEAAGVDGDAEPAALPSPPE
ncbi:MAG: HAMP domain-containing protein [Gemmatimonadetes bacterium]|nr:HAMP domain-containing protein [Gemmatimonadota bacterium]